MRLPYIATRRQVVRVREMIRQRVRAARYPFVLANATRVGITYRHEYRCCDSLGGSGCKASCAPLHGVVSH